jgi:putative oxidoreductase
MSGLAAGRLGPAKRASALVAGTFTGHPLLSWVPRIALALAIGGGGIVKLTGDPSMVTMFETIGAGQWLRVVVGVLEVAAAVGLLVPRLAFAAAVGLVALLTGAALTNVVILHSPPFLPLAFLAVAAVIAVLHRPAVLRTRTK